MAVSEVVGPHGMIFDERVSLGIILLPPAVNYPSHHHVAEDLYLVLSGTLGWTLNGEAIDLMRDGDFVHHKPWQHHSMTTGK